MTTNARAQEHRSLTSPARLRRRLAWFPLLALAVAAGLAALLLWPLGPAQAQEGDAPAVSELTCRAETGLVAFLWEAPEWSGGEVYAYDYEWTLPGGAVERSRLAKGPAASDLVVKRGSYAAGQETRFTIRPVFRTQGGDVSGAEAELVCWVGGAPAPETSAQAPPNQAPTVSSAIDDAVIVHESGASQASLSGTFSDADNDALTVSAASSNQAVATVSVAADSSSLTVTAQARGRATITVTADDGNGGTVADAFTVTVKAAPTLASALADLNGLAAGASREISLAGVFSDADGDSLTVSAGSSNNGVARVSAAANGSQLTVSGVAEGEATVSVTAEDADGNRVSDAFAVTVAAAQQPQLQQQLSSDATLSGLVLVRGGAIPLRPAFSPQTTEYGAALPVGNSWASLRPTANHAGATITVAGKAVTSGANSERFFLFINTPLRVEVVVTAEDGQTRQTYAVTATHAPSVGLSGLSLSQVKLHPFFGSRRTDYRGWVPHSVASVTVTPTNRFDKGSISVNGQPVASGTASPAIALVEGENQLTVVATAPDDYTSRTYTVTVVRASAAASADASLQALALHRATSKQPDAEDLVPYAGPAYHLTPAFSSGVYDYRVSVPEPGPDDDPLFLTALATTTAPGARSIVVRGTHVLGEVRPPKTEIVSGDASGPWQPFLGRTLITVAVTSLDGSSTKTYRIVVEQGSVAEPTGVVLTPADGSLTVSWAADEGDDAPHWYLARWREAGTATWLNGMGYLRTYRTLDGGTQARARTAADGFPVASSAGHTAHGAGSYEITGLTNGTEYEVELRGTRGGSFTDNTLTWLKSDWVTVRGTPGAAAAQQLAISPARPSRAYGATDDLSYTVSGLIDGDAAADVVTGTLARAAGDDTGSYAINLGTLAIASAYTDKYELPAAPSVATYTITPRAITAVGGVTVSGRPADGTTDAAFDTSAATGAGVLAAELADFRAGGLVVSGAFPAATAGAHELSVSYSLQDHGTFKAGNYSLSTTTAALQGELTEASCGCALMLGADAVPAEGGQPVTVTAVLGRPAGPGGVSVTLTTGGTATISDDYALSLTTIAIAPGATAGEVTLTILDDALDDGGETIILNAAVSGSSLSARPLTLTISDDDAPAPAPAPTTMTLLGQGTPAEGGDPVEVVVTLDRPAGAGGISVSLVATGTATSSDYRLSSTAINIASGESSGTTVLTVFDDTVNDPGETIIIDASAEGISLQAETLVLIIMDNDAQPVSNKPAGTPDCSPSTDGDYDDDNDGLIEICNRQQLDAIRWDLDGDGSGTNNHQARFPDAAAAMGCPETGCIGYELITDLDLGSAGWSPIELNGDGYSGVFEGNGHTISNLRVSCCGGFRMGLFRSTAADSVVRNLILRNPNLTDSGAREVGALAGAVAGRVEGVSVVDGSIRGGHLVGGIAGYVDSTGSIVGSYARVDIRSGFSSNNYEFGGLVGRNRGKVRLSFAEGTISGPVIRYAGGVAGRNWGSGSSIIGSGALVNFPTNITNRRGGVVARNEGSVVASYSAGRMGTTWAHGLIYEDRGTVTDSYWDYTKSPGLRPYFNWPGGTSGPGVAKTSDELREVLGYSGIYANWNVDLDGDGTGDDPWEFGTACQYPIPRSLGVNPTGRGGQCPLTAGLNELRLLKRLSGVSSRGQAGDNLIKDTAITDYTVQLAENVLAVSLTPTAQRPAETTITVYGESIASGDAVHIARPAPGTTKVVTVVVTEGDTVRLYTVSLVRGPQTVTAKSAPTVASALADLSGLEAGATQDVSLSGVFADADGDTLTITAASSDDATATVTMAADGSSLTVAGVAQGTATITVTARDSDGNTVSDRFDAPVAKRYAALIADIRQWRDDPLRSADPGHIERWDRALLALGETVADTTLIAMTATEAQTYVDRGWTRWEKVARALRAIEQG